MAANPSAQTGYRRAIARRGTEVKFRRISGSAPNTQSFFADVRAIHLSAVNAKAEGVFVGDDDISETDHVLIVLAEDLQAKRFDLPVIKNDRVLLGGEWTNVEKVDPVTRGFAGAIVLLVRGIR